jgi:predicted  nucleic acid-binding Zn-ribbon protein
VRGDSVDAGSVHVRLGAEVDERGFEEYDRAIERERKRKAVETKLGAELDPTAFKAYDQALRDAQQKASRRSAFKAALGADFDPRAFREYERALADADRQVVRSKTELDGWRASVTGANQAAQLFGNVLKAVKFPAFIVGAGLATQAAGALTGGVTALTSALTPLSGALAAYPAIGSAAAQGMGVFRLATSGVSDALGGLNDKVDQSSDDFKKLTPEARRFVLTLDGMKGEVRDMQRSTQRGLFPGLERGLRAASPQLRNFRAIADDTAVTLGRLAERGGRMVGSRGWMADVETQGRRNTVTIGRLGRSGLNLADAFRHVVIEAGPLVSWMTRGAVRMSEFVREQARASRESGRMAEFFGKTRDRMETVWSMTKHLARGLLEIGRAGEPLGDTILRDLDKAAGRFERWTKSARGRNEIADYFRRIKAPLYETAGLAADIAKAFARLSRGEGLTETMRALRRLVPVMEELVDTATRSFGPALVNLLESLGRLADNLLGPTGPLTVVARALAGVARSLDWMMEKVPGFERLVTAMITIAALVKGLKIAGAITGVNALAAAWGRVTGTANAAAVAQGRAAAAGAGAGAAGGRGLLATLGGGSRVAGGVGLAGVLSLLGGGINAGRGGGSGRDRGYRFLEGATLGMVSERQWRDVRNKMRQAIMGGGKAGFEETVAWMKRDRRMAQALKLKIDWDDAIRGEINGAATAAGRMIKRLEDADAAFGALIVAQRRYRRELRDLERGTGGAGKMIDLLARSQRDLRRELGRLDNIKNQAERVRALRERLSRLDKGTKEYRETAAVLRREQRRLNNTIEDANPSARKAGRAMGDLLQNARRTGNGFIDTGLMIADVTNKVLDGLGAKKINFAIKRGGRAASDVLQGRATGGMASPYGGSAADDHILVDPSGRPVAALSGTEGVVNRPQMGVIDYALRGMAALGALPKQLGSLRALWQSGMRHYATGGQLPAFARGGQMVRIPGDPDTTGGRDRVRSDIAAEVGSFIRRFGIQVGYAYDPGGGHKSPGHNVTGTALDVHPHTTGWAGVNKAVAAAVRAGKKVYYDGRFGSINLPPHGEGHHAHIEWLGGGVPRGGMAGAVSSIMAPIIEGPAGYPLRIIRAGAKKMTAAANRHLATIVPAVSGHTMPGKGGGTPAKNRILGRRMLRNDSEWPALDTLWEGESGWNQFADNPTSDAYGIPQALPGSKMASHGPDWRTNPGVQIAWGLDYIRGRYGTPSSALAAWRSRSPHWYNRGGLLPRFNGGGLLGKRTIDSPGGSGGGTGDPSAPAATNDPNADRVRGFDRVIQRLTNQYSRAESRFARTPDDNLVIPARWQGDRLMPPMIDERALTRRTNELKALERIKRKIVKVYQQDASGIRNTIKEMRKALTRLRRALKSTRSKKRRQKYQKDITRHQNRIRALGGTYDERLTELEGLRTELWELGQERKGLTGTADTQLAEAIGEPGEPTDLDSGSGDPAPTGDDPDLAAQLDQANQRIATLVEANRINTTFVRAGGGPGDVGTGLSSGALQAAYADALLPVGAGNVGLQQPDIAGAAAAAGPGLYLLRIDDPAGQRTVARASNAGNNLSGGATSPRTVTGV